MWSGSVWLTDPRPRARLRGSMTPDNASPQPTPGTPIEGTQANQTAAAVSPVAAQAAGGGAATAALYLATVLIWGTSWLAIKFQLTVPAEQSVAYRFTLAAIIQLGFCLATGRSLRFPLRDQAFIALQGALLFALNYILFYIATPHLTTGLVATLFSTIILFNIGFGAIFLRTPIGLRVLLGAVIGLAGMVLIFRPEIAKVEAGTGALIGIGLSVVATASASLGNMASVRNQRAGISVIAANTLGMAYGAAFMWGFVLLRGTPVTFDPSLLYIGSLLYLGLFASVGGFFFYLTLIGRIGADRGAYVTVVFPIVALGLSTVFEGYHWTVEAGLGVILVAAGNVLVLARLRPRAAKGSSQ
jgi:drug/metabolite transporter (DMT)-like permease